MEKGLGPDKGTLSVSVLGAMNPLESFGESFWSKSTPDLMKLLSQICILIKKDLFPFLLKLHSNDQTKERKK